MSTAREEILGRIRAATADVRSIRVAQRAESTARPGDPDLLAERIADYHATVTRVDHDDAAIAEAIQAALARHDARRVAVPPGLPHPWRPAGVELVPDDPPLDHHALAAVDAVLTGCALAIAQTGTIVLDAGPGQGRRALTLLPDLHVCVIRADQIVADVPDALATLAEPARPVTFISGPSATSDIELDRVEGVHGPRRLEVVVAA